MGKTLRDRYRDSMTIHGFGYALYEPEPSERLRPETLGYFSRWLPVLHLTDAAAVFALGCMPFTPPHIRAPDTRHWGPLTVSSDRVWVGSTSAWLGTGEMITRA